jgi:hypothetical protein
MGASVRRPGTYFKEQEMSHREKEGEIRWLLGSAGLACAEDCQAKRRTSQRIRIAAMKGPDKGCPLDKIRARYEHRNPQVLGHPSQRRCDMPNVAVCVYCSRKIDEKEKTVNAPYAAGEIAHLNCAQKKTSAPRR